MNLSYSRCILYTPSGPFQQLEMSGIKGNLGSGRDFSGQASLLETRTEVVLELGDYSQATCLMVPRGNQQWAEKQRAVLALSALVLLVSLQSATHL